MIQPLYLRREPAEAGPKWAVEVAGYIDEACTRVLIRWPWMSDRKPQKRTMLVHVLGFPMEPHWLADGRTPGKGSDDMSNGGADFPTVFEGHMVEDTVSQGSR